MQYLSGKEKKLLNEKLPKGYQVDKKDEITKNNSLIYKNKEPYLIVIDNKYYPHLKSIPEDKYQSVYVDSGAIPFVIKGADLMRPGIQKIELDISENDIIMIKDETHNKTIALGTSIYNTQDLEKQEKGKSVKIYHYVSDQYY